MKKLRCAIYTRKSTDEGLDQNFNSLDAQREACEAYIASQKHEGWHCLNKKFDDGAYSGGNMARPALQELLELIGKNQVDVIVVYKVDRLTRSLADFAKMVDVFDKKGVSFVSVTQQFNTTNSMGRLTLNVLLSFAQFEREVTAERIRDKIAASKKKGMWMGGVVPLGFDAVDRKLIINAKEAETVRTLYQLYLNHGTVWKVKTEADALGLRTKARRPNNKLREGRQSFTTGHLYQLLANPLYIGQITHKGNVYEGEHAGIVDLDVWQQVQKTLTNNGKARKVRTNFKSPCLFFGLIHDERGLPLATTHSNKVGCRYYYYVSRPDPETGKVPEDGWRLSAKALEKSILAEIETCLNDDIRLHIMVEQVSDPKPSWEKLRDRARLFAGTLTDESPAARQATILQLATC